MFRGKKYYHEFLEAGEGISTNILASRLQKLEVDGVISKKRDPDKGSRFIYSLTNKGKELLPIMLAMIVWGARYDPDTMVPPSLIEQLNDNPEELSNSILEKLD